MVMTVRFHEVGGPEVLRLDDVDPGEPGAGEVRLRVEAIGLNRAEALFRAGRYIEPVKRFPSLIGLEAAGIVDAVGPGVTAFVPGQAVSVVPSFSPNEYGMYAEAAIVPEASLIPRPDGVDAVAGAAVWMSYLTAYGCLVQVGGVRAGDTVVVTAASSSVGLAAIHTVRRIGATPIAVTRAEAKRDRLLDQGAAEVVVADREDVAERVLKLTDGAGARCVFDAVAGPGVVDLARAVAPDGTLFLYGALSGQPTPYPGFDLGMPALNMRTYTMLETSRDPERLRRAAAFITEGLREGVFHPVVDRRFALDQIVEAHRHMESGRQFGKLVAVV